MVAWPNNLRQQAITLHSLGNDNTAIMVFLLVLGGCTNELEQCVAHALVDPWPRRAALNIEVVSLLLGDMGFIDFEVHQAIRGISCSNHCTLKVTDEHAIGVCFECTAFSY